MLYDRSDARLAVHQGVTSPGLSSNDLHISVADRRTRYSLRARPDAADQLRSRTGLPLPTRINHSAEDKTIQISCLGPDEWLLVAENRQDLQARFTFDDDEMPSLPFSLVDVSHRSVAIAISGANAERAIRAGCPLDLDLAAFPVSRVTRTVFERAEIILFRKAGDQFEIDIWRSFAPYLLALLRKAGSGF